MPQQDAARRSAPRSLDLSEAILGLLWLVAARAGASSAAQGFARVLHSDALRLPLEQLFLLILLLTGFTALHYFAVREGRVRETNGLLWRATAPREWQKGLALGWALLLLAVLPMVLAARLVPRFTLGVSAWGTTLLSLLTLLLASLAIEVAFRGFVLRRMVAATGPVRATVLVSLLYAYLVTWPAELTPLRVFVSFAAGVLFSVAALRTHALWLGWGLRMGWMAATAVVFGLPLAGSVDLGSVVATESTGPSWLTGGTYGPDGAFFTGLVLLAGAVVLFWMTREYAWAYTFEPIIPGGFPMDVPPPAAHAAMVPAPPPPLVQIGMPSAPAMPLPSRRRSGTEAEIATGTSDGAPNESGESGRRAEDDLVR